MNRILPCFGHGKVEFLFDVVRFEDHSFRQFYRIFVGQNKIVDPFVEMVAVNGKSIFPGVLFKDKINKRYGIILLND